jgi:hypothetical protein
MPSLNSTLKVSGAERIPTDMLHIAQNIKLFILPIGDETEPPSDLKFSRY